MACTGTPASQSAATSGSAGGGRGRSLGDAPRRLRRARGDGARPSESPGAADAGRACRSAPNRGGPRGRALPPAGELEGGPAGLRAAGAMNILPKKSWHVRNKDNVARVRRDEAQAREEEKARERRALLAQQEARTEFLRKKARLQSSVPATEAAEAGAPRSGPVDLFRELLEEGKGVTEGNKEYEEEKRQDRERQERALGILTYLGQSAAEAQTQPPWYQLPPRREGPPPGSGPDEKIKSRLDPLREVQKHLGKKRRHSGEDGDRRKKAEGSGRQQPRGPPSLDQLRAERLRREAAERARAEALLARVQGQAPQEGQPEEETDDRRRRYNSQFNPQLARRPRRQDHLAH